MNPHQKRDVTERIWRDLSDRLRQFVAVRIDSSADVDDVLQTVFLRIHRNIDRLRQADRLESWVFQITRNAVTDHFRSKRDTQNDIECLEIPGTADTSDFHAELLGCLGMLITRLPEDQQRAISKYELQGVSQKDIARRESISISGVKSRIQRGRKSLKMMLKQCCEIQFDRRGNVVEYEATATECCECNCR